MEEGTAGDKQIINSVEEINAFAVAQNANPNNNLGHLTTSGDFRSGQQHRVGVNGFWWSASRHSDARSYYLRLDYDKTYLQGDNKLDGRFVRCILRDS